MRKLQFLTAAAALVIAAPLMAQGRHDRVPPGQLPPPGMCRIWLPGVPAGRQPAPMSCNEAARRLPPNARILYSNGTWSDGYYDNGYYNGGYDPYYDNRVYQNEIVRERELQIARDRQLQIDRERELQIAREREIEATREHAIRDRDDHAWDRNRDGDRDRDHNERARGTNGQGNVQITRGTDGRPIAVQRNPYFHR